MKRKMMTERPRSVTDAGQLPQDTFGTTLGRVAVFMAIAVVCIGMAMTSPLAWAQEGDFLPGLLDVTSLSDTTAVSAEYSPGFADGSCDNGSCGSAACSTCCGGEAMIQSCGECISGCGMDGGWNVRVGGLIMGRNEPNRRVVAPFAPRTPDEGYNAFSLGATLVDSYFESLGGDEIYNTDAGIPWQGGIDTRISYDLNPCWGLEIGYWGIWNMDTSNSIHNVYDAEASLFCPFEPIVLKEQYASFERKNDFHNVEINILRTPTPSCNSTNRTQWLAGFHYFRFEESLSFGEQKTFEKYRMFGCNDLFTKSGYLGDDVENNLWGFKVGGRINRCVGERLSIGISPAVGIYVNHVEHEYRSSGGLCQDDLSLGSEEDGVAFIGSCDLEARYQMTCNWSAFCGYRVMFTTGVALADNQLPYYGSTYDDLHHVDMNGDLLLHGAMAGVELRY